MSALTAAGRAAAQYIPQLPTGFTRDATSVAYLETVDSTGNTLSTSDDSYVYVECQFNPEEIKVVKKYNWTEHKIPFMNQPDLDPGGGDAAVRLLARRQARRFGLGAQRSARSGDRG